MNIVCHITSTYCAINREKNIGEEEAALEGYMIESVKMLEELKTAGYKWEHYLQPINRAPRRHKPGSVARGCDRPRRVPCDDATWAPLGRRSRDVDRGRATR